MPKSEGQKLKLLYLADLLRRETDEDHALSMSDILSRLEELGVHAERKSIYDDLRALEDYGMDIIATRGRAGGYQLAHREFELPELKLLVDAVQSSKFLSVKKSRELIRKLEGLASRWEAQSLQRQVYAVGRVKSMNESIYYSIDTIHTAISQDRQIAFRYFEWTMEKTVRYRRDGQLYERSPYALVWDDENYYLVAYDHTASPPGIRHYRVDKMANLSVLEESRLGKATFDGFDMAQYAKQMFGMFGGAQQDVELRFAARLAGVVLDRFGKEVLGMTVSLSHISDIRLKASREQAENFRELIVSYSEDPRVILIKLADRLEVMRSLEMFPREKWRKKSWESMNLYAQIAHKLGLYSLKSELEDIALKYLEPADYAYIENVRTMDKAVRGIRKALLPKLGGELYVNAETGQLASYEVEYLTELANKPLEDMQKAGELSGMLVEIDPDQDVLSTSELEFVIKQVGVGVLRRIRCKIGFAKKA